MYQQMVEYTSCIAVEKNDNSHLFGTLFHLHWLDCRHDKKNRVQELNTCFPFKLFCV